MKKFFLIFLFFTFYVYSFEKIKIRELYEKAKKFEGKVIAIEGEAIGDIMGKGEEKWINIKDEKDDFAIGVIIDKKDVAKIKNLGKYGIKGDILKIEGIYNVNCTKHQGERDIHAIKVELIQQGKRLPTEEITLKKIFLTFILLGLTVFIINLYHR